MDHGVHARPHVAIPDTPKDTASTRTRREGERENNTAGGPWEAGVELEDKLTEGCPSGGRVHASASSACSLFVLQRRGEEEEMGTEKDEMHDGSGLSGLMSRVLVYGWDYEWDWDLHTSIRAVPRPGCPGRPPPLSKHPPTFPPAKSSTKARGGRRFTVQHAPTPPSLPLVDASKTRVIGRMLIVINNTCSPPLRSLSPPPPHLLPPIIDVHAAPHGDSGACSATVEELTVLPLKSIPQASLAISTCPRPASRTSSPDPPSLVFTPILLRWPKATDLRRPLCVQAQPRAPSTFNVTPTLPEYRTGLPSGSYCNVADGSSSREDACTGAGTSEASTMASAPRRPSNQLRLTRSYQCCPSRGSASHNFIIHTTA
ncbi:hypothetical protein EDB85DRAFT_2165099 [Lactarius pseudohatsudake]|nr:hypothetical protein EDB85DRAFT_2165099 [Lactarius pseudohatsudake]